MIESESFFYEIVRLVSNGLAIPVLLMSLAVVIVWYTPAKKTLRNFIKTPEQWFILGVFFGFMGEFFDNLYWTIAWTAHYLEDPTTPTLMNFGVVPNIPFRQILSLVAAFCHIRSAIEYSRIKSNYHSNNIYFLNLLLIFLLSLGFLFSTSLFFIKH